MKNRIYNLLRWSEKYTKTDMLYLAKGGSWLTLGHIIASSSTFLLAIAFANLLPRETYGAYKYVLSVASILAIPTLSGMNTAIIQAVARKYEGSFTRALKTKIYWGLLGSIGGLILATYYYINKDFTLTISFLIIAAFTPFFESFNLYGALLNGRKLFSISTKYSVSTQIISTTSIIITVFLTNNILIILLSYFIPQIILRFLFFKITTRKLQLNTREDPHTIGYGKHLSLMGVLGVIATQIDKILIFHYLGVVEMAIYIFAVSMPEQVKGMFKSIAILALPKFAERDTNEIKLNMRGKTIKLGIVSFIIVIIYIILAPFIYKTLFPQYLESIFYSQIFALSLITVVTMIPTGILHAKSAKKELYKLNIFGSIFQITILFIFIYFHGLIGAIIARVVFRFAYATYAYYLTTKI